MQLAIPCHAGACSLRGRICHLRHVFLNIIVSLLFTGEDMIHFEEEISVFPGDIFEAVEDEGSSSDRPSRASDAPPD
jgi:hypothetical protein